MRMGNHLLMHVVITIFDHQFDVAIRMQPFTDLFGDLHHFAFARFKLLAIEIAQNVVHLRPVDAALDAGQVIKTLITVGGFRGLTGRHFGVNTRRQR